MVARARWVAMLGQEGRLSIVWRTLPDLVFICCCLLLPSRPTRVPGCLQATGMFVFVSQYFGIFGGGSRLTSGCAVVGILCLMGWLYSPDVLLVTLQWSPTVVFSAEAFT